MLAGRINIAQQRLATAQEQVSSGKRINRPSDDPFGAEAVLRFRTSQSDIDAFQQNAATVKDNLQIADTSMESYQQLLDRSRALLAQGSSDTTPASSKQSIATELDGIRTQMLAIANSKSSDRYVFGGNRQNVPPYDSAGVPAATPTSIQMVQIEPGAQPVAAGVTADAIFANAGGTIFDTMANAIAALRGTGNPAADQATLMTAQDSLVTFTDQGNVARGTIGASLNTVDSTVTRLQTETLAYQESSDHYEMVDFAAAATEITQASNALQATLQATAITSQKQTLMDLIA
jgi:flagellar hook-associated protein 3 FlgL